MELLQAMKPVFRLPFRSRLPVPVHTTARAITTSQSVHAQSTNASPTTPSPAAPSLANLGQSFRPKSLRPEDLFARDRDSEHALQQQPWHLHAFCHKHNTHLTLTRPNRAPVISISTGQIGFKKAQRGSYDAAYQLGAYMMARVARAGLIPQIDNLELVFRGFGQGREAVGKIVTGTEGSVLRNKIVKVTDATRLKFGGTRSPRPRRLG